MSHQKEKKSSWRQAILTGKITIEQAIRNLEQVAIKIILIVGERGELVGTISDGDIRRGLLRGLTLSSDIDSLINRNPFVVPPNMARETVMQLMVANKVHQIPVVDEHQNIVSLHLWNEINSQPNRPNLMVIMAGGKGTRMRPHTENCPKPLLPVAGKPILEHIIVRAQLEGFARFILAIHYLGDMIESHFGNGERFGVEINYLREENPLGTAGALSMLKQVPVDPFIVTNGDIITKIRYSQILDFHNRHNANATMAVHLHEWTNPFGVVHTNGMDIIDFEEKPIIRTQVNAGVYVIAPDALPELKENTHCDMPTLFKRLQNKSKRTIAYPIHEQWLDVGRPEDLLNAQKLK